MRSVVRVGLVAALTLSTLYGCEDAESMVLDPELPEKEESTDSGSGPKLGDGGERGDGAVGDGQVDAGHGQSGRDDHEFQDGGVPLPDASPGTPPQQPVSTPRTQVPDELVGAWENGTIDFDFWENYRIGYWAGRNAIPSREAMVFKKNGDAKFYRYEAAFNFYEELIDCEGSVAFHDDGTFTFYPVQGRKRFHDLRHSEQNTDRPLTDEELVDPKLAGTRAYAYLPSSEPPALQITVPSSAPYNWYKKP